MGRAEPGRHILRRTAHARGPDASIYTPSCGPPKGVCQATALALGLGAESPVLVRSVLWLVERLAGCSRRSTRDPTQTHPVTPRRRKSTARQFAGPLVAGLFAAALVPVPAIGVPVAQARAVTCQGQTATVVGPTVAGGTDTVGTEGDDVIVAPIGTSGSVQGLGGDDTICLVDRVNTPVHDATGVTVQAGPGDDAVFNESTTGLAYAIELGADADHLLPGFGKADKQLERRSGATAASRHRPAVRARHQHAKKDVLRVTFARHFARCLVKLSIMPMCGRGRRRQARGTNRPTSGPARNRRSRPTRSPCSRDRGRPR